MANLYQQAGQAIEAQRESLAVAIVDRQWQLYPELAVRYDKSGYAKCIQDVQYNLMYLAQAIGVESPILFVHYIDWVNGLFAQLNIAAGRSGAQP